jgi:hypothetical protein
MMRTFAVQVITCLGCFAAGNVFVASVNASEDCSRVKERITLELSPCTIRARVGRVAELEMTFTNTSPAPVDVFDPKLDELLWTKRAISLTICDENGAYLGDLLHKREGSSSSPSAEDWTTLKPGAKVKTVFRFKAGLLRSSETAVPVELGPGTYYIRAEAYNHLVSGRPDLTELELAQKKAISQLSGTPVGDVKLPSDLGAKERQPRIPYGDWEQTFPGDKIGYSNKVKLVVLPRTGD